MDNEPLWLLLTNDLIFWQRKVFNKDDIIGISERKGKVILLKKEMGKLSNVDKKESLIHYLCITKLATQNESVKEMFRKSTILLEQLKNQPKNYFKCNLCNRSIGASQMCYNYHLKGEHNREYKEFIQLMLEKGSGLHEASHNPHFFQGGLPSLGKKK